MLKYIVCIAQTNCLSWEHSVVLYWFYGASGASKERTKWKIPAQRIQLLLCTYSCAAPHIPQPLLYQAAHKGCPNSSIKCQVVQEHTDWIYKTSVLSGGFWFPGHIRYLINGDHSLLATWEHLHAALCGAKILMLMKSRVMKSTKQHVALLKPASSYLETALSFQQAYSCTNRTGLFLPLDRLLYFQLWWHGINLLLCGEMIP